MLESSSSSNPETSSSDLDNRGINRYPAVENSALMLPKWHSVTSKLKFKNEEVCDIQEPDLYSRPLPIIEPTSRARLVEPNYCSFIYDFIILLAFFKFFLFNLF